MSGAILFVAGIFVGLSCARLVCVRIMRKAEALQALAASTLAAARHENARTTELLAKVTAFNDAVRSYRAN